MFITEVESIPPSCSKLVWDINNTLRIIDNIDSIDSEDFSGIEWSIIVSQKTSFYYFEDNGKFYQFSINTEHNLIYDLEKRLFNYIQSGIGILDSFRLLML